MRCRICGEDQAHRVHDVREMMLGRRDLHRYFECSRCGCLQIATLPENLADYYPDNYYSYRDPGQSGNAVKRLLTRWRDTYATTGHNPLGHVLQALSPDPKLATLRATGVNRQSRILDVGCGAGHLLYALREAGFRNLLGLDPFNRENIRYPNGLRIDKRDLLTETVEWDLIMFHHSFEHLPDQQATLQQAWRILPAGGMALVRVPTVSSFAWQHYGPDWVQLDAPRHLYLHSITSMNTLAEQSGFVMEQVIYDSNALQFWGSEQYQQDIPLRDARSYAENPAGGLFSKRQMRDFTRRAHELNALQQGDQAAFYLRKPTS